MIRLVGGTAALLAFSAAIVAGLIAENAMVTVLKRALTAMVLFLMIGSLLGWVGEMVLRDHLNRLVAQREAESATAETAEATDAADTDAAPPEGAAP